MEKLIVNESPLDRALRAFFGVLLTASPVLGFHTMPYNFIGIVVAVTGVVGHCPLYGLLRVSSGNGFRRHQPLPG